MMNVTDFITKVKEIESHKTVYMWGTFGTPVTEEAIERYEKEYPGWYTPEKVARFKELISRDYFGFDCVGVIKAVLWGWCADSAKTYGGAEYGANGVSDVSADGMIAKCSNVTADFGVMMPGEAVWMEGHIGVYIGEGKCIECTPIWKDGAQITALGNIGKIEGLETRTWEKHGKIPCVDYAAIVAPEKEVAKVEEVKVADGNTPSVWAEPSVAKAKALKIIAGDANGNLKLQDTVTREQLMVFFDRLGLLK